MIRDRSRPLPPADSGWKPLPSPEPSVIAQEPEDQTIPMFPVTHLPQLDYSDPNTVAPTIMIDDSTPFATSTESFSAVANTSEGSPMRAEAGERPQSVDSGDDRQVELPTGPLSNPPPSAPPSSPTIPSPLPGPDRELLSAPPVQKKSKSWFQKVIFDHDP
ncbi:hypothetical protein EDB86DRAFT_2939433 [Lactarius hatsudake]|nr:hypothetical protein EDB86DRAFT_2939433 [Lactarius hatsudake]